MSIGPQMTETLEQCAEQLATEFPEKNDTLLDLEQSANALSVSSASVLSYIRTLPIPVERCGRKVYLRQDVVQQIKQLREQHGCNWHANLPWSREEEEVSQENQPSIAQKMILKAKDFQDAGQHAEACEIYQILIEHVDWSNTL